MLGRLLLHLLLFALWAFLVIIDFRDWQQLQRKRESNNRVIPEPCLCEQLQEDAQ